MRIDIGGLGTQFLQIKFKYHENQQYPFGFYLYDPVFGDIVKQTFLSSEEAEKLLSKMNKYEKRRDIAQLKVLVAQHLQRYHRGEEL